MSLWHLLHWASLRGGVQVELYMLEMKTENAPQDALSSAWSAMITYFLDFPSTSLKVHKTVLTPYFCL